MEILNGIMWGTLGGIVMAGAGYMKNMKTETFDLSKAVVTIVIGGCVGAVLTQVEGVDLATYDTVAFSGMVTYIAQNLFKLMEAVKK